MSSDKKQARAHFYVSVIKRDGHRCRVCRKDELELRSGEKLDAHHIMDRHDMPNGGYVAGNGISLCPSCHLKAEQWHSTGTPAPGYSPEELYAMIGSSLEAAIAASERLGDDPSESRYEFC